MYSRDTGRGNSREGGLVGEPALGDQAHQRSAPPPPPPRRRRAARGGKGSRARASHAPLVKSLGSGNRGRGSGGAGRRGAARAARLPIASSAIWHSSHIATRSRFLSAATPAAACAQTAPG